MGLACDWATTLAELDEALTIAGEGERGCYIEIITAKYEAPALPKKLHDSIETLYST